jgi:YebC/PmpR family DNA-binding regulatory protein
MAGHSHWKQIKLKKASIDQKRSKLFSKLLNAITIAARNDPNPDFNPRLRSAILKAKEFQVPQENINKAIQKSKEKNSNLEELLLEGYGPGGVAFLIEVITDKSTRTVNEIKSILKDFDAKLGEPGSARWAFEKDGDEWNPKFMQEIKEEEKEKIKKLLDALFEHDDVQDIFVNTNVE